MTPTPRPLPTAAQQALDEFRATVARQLAEAAERRAEAEAKRMLIVLLVAFVFMMGAIAPMLVWLLTH